MILCIRFICETANLIFTYKSTILSTIESRLCKLKARYLILLIASESEWLDDVAISGVAMLMLFDFNL